jgi:hypothetical protein
VDSDTKAFSFYSINGMVIDMTEDHRVVSATERARIARMGQSLKDGEKRLNGMVFCLIFCAEYFSLPNLP